MAVLLGTSGAWVAMQTALRSRHLEALHPRDLASLLQQMRVSQEKGLGLVYLAFQSELEEEGKRIDQLHWQFAHSTALRTQHFTEEIAQAEQKLSEYRSRAWISRWTTLLLPTWRILQRKKALLKWKEQTVQMMRADLAAQRQGYLYKRQNRDEVVRRRFQEVADNITFLEQVLHSPELAGVNAELEVIECLRTLPDSYYVCSDVNLTARRRIRFQGEYLQTAQIDHLVVGPGGVFVLEVKRWGRQFVDRGQFFNPYEQVARASYLCYDLIRSHLSGIRVRSVLVNCGAALPACLADFHVKTVTLSQLLGYVTWSHKPVLGKEQVAQIMRILGLMA